MRWFAGGFAGWVYCVLVWVAYLLREFAAWWACLWFGVGVRWVLWVGIGGGAGVYAGGFWYLRGWVLGMGLGSSLVFGDGFDFLSLDACGGFPG